VKAHKAALVLREQELVARESVLAAHEAAQNAAITQKDGEIASLRAQLAELAASIASRVQSAVATREEELRNAVLEYEKIVESRVQRREEEIMEAVRVREAELFEAWQTHEASVRAACQAELEERWRIEQEKLQRMKEEMEEKARAIEEGQQKGKIRWCRPVETLTSSSGQKKSKTPLEEVKNILAPLAQLTRDPHRTPRPNMTSPTRPNRRPIETPVDRMASPAFPIASAMKGVILTATGEPLATPTPTKLVELLVDSPRMGGSLGFAKIFDFDKLDEEESGEEGAGKKRSMPRSPSKRKADAVISQAQAGVSAMTLSRGDSATRSPSKRKSVSSSQSQSAAVAPVPTRAAPAAPSRLRRPSVSSRSNGRRVEAAAADTAGQLEDRTITTTCSSLSSSSSSNSSRSSSNTQTINSGDACGVTPAAPVYNMEDEENLPSPFLRRVEREGGGGVKATVTGGGSSMMITRVKRTSGANLLRATAAANNAKTAATPMGTKGMAVGTLRRAGEEARKVLLRV
jgi:NIMA (never in mitosis gene a)-related kinase 2